MGGGGEAVWGLYYMFMTRHLWSLENYHKRYRRGKVVEGLDEGRKSEETRVKEDRVTEWDKVTS